jgi:hypothetical protein
LYRYTAGKLACVGSPLFLKTRFGVGYHLTLVLGSTDSPGSGGETSSSVSAITDLVLGVGLYPKTQNPKP